MGYIIIRKLTFESRCLRSVNFPKKGESCVHGDDRIFLYRDGIIGENITFPPTRKITGPRSYSYGLLSSYWYGRAACYAEWVRNGHLSLFLYYEMQTAVTSLQLMEMAASKESNAISLETKLKILNEKDTK